MKLKILFGNEVLGKMSSIYLLLNPERFLQINPDMVSISTMGPRLQDHQVDNVVTQIDQRAENQISLELIHILYRYKNVPSPQQVLSTLHIKCMGSAGGWLTHVSLFTSSQYHKITCNETRSFVEQISFSLTYKCTHFSMTGQGY